MPKTIDPAVIADENARTTPRGLYHYAQSFREAADVTASHRPLSTHFETPRLFLYYHAIELFLKAYLRNAGWDIEQLKKLGHRFGRLGAEFEKAGGFLMDEDREVLGLLDETDAWEMSRYFRTGFFTRPTLEALERTARSLAETTCETLVKNRDNTPILAADMKSILG